MFRWMSVTRCGSYAHLVLAVALIHPQSSAAKCISLEIAMEGDIVGEGEDLAVSVEVISATKGDSMTEVRQESRIEKAHFRATAWFNTTSNVISKETCDRLPRLVIIKLMSGRNVLDRQTLRIKSDFRRTREGAYQLKRPITLHVPIEK
jgi:hypothetical protein